MSGCHFKSMKLGKLKTIDALVLGENIVSGVHVRYRVEIDRTHNKGVVIVGLIYGSKNSLNVV